MNEYVNVEDVFHTIDLVMSDDNIKHKGKAIRKRLSELPPADVVEVVRCKDCKYYSVSHLACLYPYHNREAIKAEAVKEFAERLKLATIYIPSYYFNYATVVECIDNLVKEMVGEG